MGARTPSRALRATRAAIALPNRGAASHLSAACSVSPPMTALTLRTTRPPCPATSPRAPSRTMCGTAPTSTRTSRSFLLLPWLATQVGSPVHAGDLTVCGALQEDTTKVSHLCGETGEGFVCPGHSSGDQARIQGCRFCFGLSRHVA